MSESDDFVKKTNKRKKQVEKKPKKDQKEPKAKKSKVEKPSPEKTEEEEEEEEEEYKWWKDDQADDSVKWTTLQHAGPLFPPPYVPHGIKMKYDGISI